MITRIEITSVVPDARAQVRKKKLTGLGFSTIEDIWIHDVYTIDKKLTPQQLQRIAVALTNPVTQHATISKSQSPEKFTTAIEIGFLPGVTDNVAFTAKEIIEDLLKMKFGTNENVFTSQITFISGQLSNGETRSIANSLYNPVIQQARIKSFSQFKKNKGMDIAVPSVHLREKPVVDEVNLQIPDDELKIIGKQGIANNDGSRRGPLALDLLYMKAIQEYFKSRKRNPTDIELESIAQTWSEHCKHTIFADPIDEIKDGLYKTYIKGATALVRKKMGKKDFCVSVFTDNSGAIVFDDTYIITDKVETHNSPSALDPFGGAITGIVGVNRDTIGFGLGAKPVINRYGFCFADPADSVPLYKGAKNTQKMLSPRRIMDGVIDGVNSGGNCSGIPTPQGFMYFDSRYKGKPLVFVGTVGLLPKKAHGRVLYKKKARVGDYIVMIGGRVGQDGIHGATFSSEAMDSGSPATAVQIGDPITQKKLSDAVVKEARDSGMYHSITDNGAGGLSCSVAEMAKECGGCLVNLDAVPLKYPGLAPWQIWISESQERMTLAVPKAKWKAFEKLMKKRGVEATVIGTFTDSGKCMVKYGGKTIMDIGMDFLHNGLPEKKQISTYNPIEHTEPVITKKKDLTKAVLQMVSRLNICSRSFISTQYDHEVQAGSVLKPLQGKGLINGDATVTRPVLSSERGVVLSQGLYPRYSDIDTYHMAACSIDTAIRNAVTAGADISYLALLDNFCWCSSTEPERLGQLKRAAKACYDYTVAFGTPLISGKDSMFNDFKGYDEQGNPVKISIAPTVLISSIGVMQNVTKAISIDSKFSGDLVYVLGETYDELGGSEYFAMIGEEKNGEPFIGNRVPNVDAQRNKKLYTAFHKAVKKELISSAVSVAHGGLAVAFMKTAMAGKLGLDVSLKGLPGSVGGDSAALFSESQGRIVVTIDPGNKKQFEAAMKGNSFIKVGKVNASTTITIAGLQGLLLVDTSVEESLKMYKKTFNGY